MTGDDRRRRRHLKGRGAAAAAAASPSTITGLLQESTRNRWETSRSEKYHFSIFPETGKLFWPLTQGWTTFLHGLLGNVVYRLTAHRDGEFLLRFSAREPLGKLIDFPRNSLRLTTNTPLSSFPKTAYSLCTERFLQNIRPPLGPFMSGHYELTSFTHSSQNFIGIHLPPLLFHAENHQTWNVQIFMKATHIHSWQPFHNTVIPLQVE